MLDWLYLRNGSADWHGTKGLLSIDDHGIDLCVTIVGWVDILDSNLWWLQTWVWRWHYSYWVQHYIVHQVTVLDCGIPGAKRHELQTGLLGNSYSRQKSHLMQHKGQPLPLTNDFCHILTSKPEVIAIWNDGCAMNLQLKMNILLNTTVLDLYTFDRQWFDTLLGPMLELWRQDQS